MKQHPFDRGCDRTFFFALNRKGRNTEEPL